MIPSTLLWTFLALIFVQNHKIQAAINKEVESVNHDLYFDQTVCNDISESDCECSNHEFLIPCNDMAIYTPMKNCSRHYCSSQKCNYTVTPNKNCQSNYYSMRFVYSLRVGNKTAQDRIVVYSGGNKDITLISTNNTQLSHTKLAYSSMAEVKIDFTSTSEPINKTENPRWVMEITPINGIIFINNITLDETNPTFVFWLDDLKPYNALKVCSSNKDLEIFIDSDIYMLSDFYLYDSDDLKTFVSTLDSNEIISPSQGMIPRNLKSKSGCFTIFRNENSSDASDATFTTILFRINKIHTKGCKSNNVFDLSDTSFNYTVAATNQYQCEIIILSLSNSINPGIAISYISPPSKDAKFTFKSAVNGRNYVDIDASNVDQWYSFGINTPALSIIIPPSNEIIVQASILHDVTTTYLNDDENQSGIIASQSYSGFTDLIASNYTLLNEFVFDHKRNITFNMKEILGNSNVKIQNYDKNTSSIMVTKGQKLSIVGKTISVYYREKDSTKDGFLIEYYIDQTTLGGNNSATFLNVGYIFFLTILMSLFCY